MKFTDTPRRFCCLLLAGLFTFAAQAPAATPDPTSDDPEVERQLLQLPPGFDIQLYASEPDIINPVTINFDSRGRLWALCLPTYPHILPGQTPHDYIRVLDPADASGHAPSSHVFATGLTVPTGMIPSGSGAYVGETDSLVYLKDTDGDGKADQRQLLLTGFGTQDIHHTLNTFRFGPDGSLYFDQGIYILSSVETPAGLRKLFGGCVWQLRPDSLALEVFDRSILPNNTWGHVFDDYGRSLLSSAWPADINLVLPETPLNHADDPTVVPALPMTKLAGDRHSGLERITGRHFPPDWQNNLVSGNFQSQRVNRFALDETAGHLTAKELDPLVISHHNKFRPVDMKIGPDGALYIADWYNLIIQHNQVDFRDPRRDHGHGRIWRITYKGRPLVPIPDLTVPTPALLDHLKDPEQWTRDQTRRVLAQRDKTEVAAALATWTAANPTDEHGLLEALWSYQTIDTPDPKLLTQLLSAKEPLIRAAATTVLGYWSDRLPDTITLLTQRAADPDPRVRLAAVLAAQRIPTIPALQAALTALDHPTDPMLDFELRKTLIVLRPYWYPAFDAGTFTFDNNPRRTTFALLALRTPDVVSKLLPLLAQADPHDKTEILAAIAAVGDAQQIATVLDAIFDTTTPAPDRTRLTDALADVARTRGIIPAHSDLTRILPAIAQGDLPALRLAAAWHLAPAVPTLVQLAEDDHADPALRKSALTALAEIAGDDAKSQLAILAAKPSPIRNDAIVALAALDQSHAITLAAQSFHDPSATGTAPLFAALVRRAGAPDALADAMLSVKPAPDAAKLFAHELTASGIAAPRLAALLQSASNTAATKRDDSPDVIRQIAQLAATQGDPARGEHLFRSATLGCTRCHAIAGGGGNVGPDLAAIGGSAPPDSLVAKILAPSKHVREGFTSLLVRTKDGDALTGILLRDTPDSLILRDAARDEIPIPKNYIKSQKSIGTLMPNGLSDSLTDAQFADLVRFLSALGKPGPYDAGHAPVARRWYTLPQYPPAWFAEPAARAAYVQNETVLPWLRVFATTAGTVPLDDVAFGSPKSGALLRCILNVTAPGPIALTLNDPRALTLWVDGKPTTPASTIPLDLPAGPHALIFSVNVPARANLPLRCELADVPGSSGRAAWDTK